MKWFYLLLAGGFEVFWAIELKYSLGFSRLLPSVFTVLGMMASFYFLSLALKGLPLGNAYAIWTGIGMVGTAILGIILFKEPMSVLRILFVCLIITGIIGLKISS